MANHDLAEGARVVVIGSGAGGATVFRALARQGIDVLLLEEGHDNSSATGYPGRLSDLTARLYRNGGLSPVMGLPPFAFGEGRTLGGTTEINGGLFWRTPEWILDDWSTSRGLAHLSPTILEPLFEELETDLRAAPTAVVPGLDRDSALLADGARSLGWNIVPAQRVVPGCARHNQCGSGCAIGAKQSMSFTYIPQGVAAGGRVATGVRAVGFKTKGVRVTHVTVEEAHGLTDVPCDEVVVCGGALQTPALLRRSGLSRLAGKRLGFHLNTKILASFPDDVDADRGTMFTHQVQEFMREGILIMAANYRPEYLSLAIAGWENEQIEEIMSGYHRLGMYTMMVRTMSYGRLVIAGKSSVPWFRLGPDDRRLLEVGTLRTVEALLSAGAVELYLPVGAGRGVRNMGEAREVLATAGAMDWEISSVHAMASCSMGTDGNRHPVDPSGRLRGWQNVSVADASVLPSTVGESPQETIMALSSQIAHAVAQRSGRR